MKKSLPQLAFNSLLKATSKTRNPTFENPVKSLHNQPPVFQNFYGLKKNIQHFFQTSSRAVIIIQQETHVIYQSKNHYAKFYKE